MGLTNANNTIELTVSSADSQGNTSYDRDTRQLTLNGLFGSGTINTTLQVGTFVLPITGTVFNLFVKNNASLGSGNTIQVNATLTGGTTQILAVLQPDGVLCIWNTNNLIAASGYTAVSLVVSGGIIPTEYFFGG